MGDGPREARRGGRRAGPGRAREEGGCAHRYAEEGARWTPRRAAGAPRVARRVATDDVGAETAAARIAGAVGVIAAIAAVVYAGDEVGTARA